MEAWVMARSFDGTANRIATGLNVATLTGGASTNTSPFSFSCWALLGTGAGSFPTVVNSQGGLGGQIVGIGQNFGSAAGVNVYIAGLQTQNPATITTNVWHHLAFTYNGGITSGLKVYVDGTDVSTSNSGTMAAGPFNGTMNIADGTNGGNSFWKGNLADAAFWNIALTPAEVAALAKGARPGTVRPLSLLAWLPIGGIQSPEPDLSGNANNGTLTGTAPVFGPPTMPYTRRMPQFPLQPPPPAFTLMPQILW
jgi:hypothetical protein